MSWAAVCGIDKEIRRRWGRWRPSVDEAYVTTPRKLVLEAQKEVARRVRNIYGVSDLVDDLATIGNFTLWLQDIHGKPPSQANREAGDFAPPQSGLQGSAKPVEGGGAAEEVGGNCRRRRSSTLIQVQPTLPRRSSRRKEKTGTPIKQTRVMYFPWEPTSFWWSVGHGGAPLHVIGGCYRILGIHYTQGDRRGRTGRSSR